MRLASGLSALLFSLAPLTVPASAEPPAVDSKPPKKAIEGPGPRLFFPRGMVRGFVEFQIAPPHNEIDLGLCSLNQTNPSQFHPTCTGYARYMWGGYLELQPVGRGPFRRLILFMEPKVFGGDNMPQQRYTASGALILWERSMGLGIKLPRDFELRLTNHQTSLLGRYRYRDNVNSLRTDGPYGINTTVGVRWYFGGWGRSLSAE